LPPLIVLMSSLSLYKIHGPGQFGKEKYFVNVLYYYSKCMKDNGEDTT